MNEEEMTKILTQFSEENDVLSGEHVKDIVELLADEMEMKVNWFDAKAEDIIKEIVKVSEEVYEGDPMPEETVIHAALVAGKDEVIKALRNGTIHP